MCAARPPFISYSANREDVLLDRVFREQAGGHYVDVGAAHPLFENDTRALYDRGWSGVNIEPNLAFFEQLAEQRGRDRNLNLAISDRPGFLTFHEVVGTGLSTCDEEEAARVAARGLELVDHRIAADTLRHVLEVAGLPHIDLLKVDVEGYELKVLQSNDWARFRPRLVLVEVTYPETPQRRPDSISPFLAEQGYRRVYFDGLNDYFVEASFEPPEDAFASPPNVFDRIVAYADASIAAERRSLAEECDALRAEAAELERRLRQCRQRHLALETDLGRAHAATIKMRDHAAALARDLEAMADVERQEVQAMLDSTSWRLTRPLRSLKEILKR